MNIKLLIRIAKHEVGLWFRHSDFRQLLPAGTYVLPGRLGFGHRVEVVDTLQTEFRHPLLEVLLRDAALRERLEVVELTDTQRALVWKDERLTWVLGPGRHAFWKEPHALRAKVHDAGRVRFEHPQLATVIGRPAFAAFFDVVRVAPHERALVFVNGEQAEALGPGAHAFWKGAASVTWAVVDLREKVADVAGQEIMTADKVTLRVNLVVTYRVVDPQRAVTVVRDADQALYREAQLALRAAVGARPLERVLTAKEAVGAEVQGALGPRAAQWGLAVAGVGIRDVILPGEMKTILNQVIEAEKRAEANLIRRREETAAARSQANTARLLAENPVLARMKELEALQEILAGARATFVLGPGDVAAQVRGLIREQAKEG